MAGWITKKNISFIVRKHRLKTTKGERVDKEREIDGGREGKQKKYRCFCSLVLEKLLNDNDPKIVFVNKFNGIQEGKRPRCKIEKLKTFFITKQQMEDRFIF